MNFKILVKKSSNKKVTFDITQLVSAVTWHGTDSQASRKLEFSTATSPFDLNFPQVEISTGDIVYFYFEKELKFIGRVTSFSRSSGSGETSYTAADYLNLLLKSNVKYVFKHKTPEQITKKVLSDLGLAAGETARTKINIKKWIIDGENAYNVIVGAYFKAHKKTGKRYMPVMDGIKVTVVEKGKSSGVTLSLENNIKSTSLEENADDIVNRVLIFNEKGKKIGEVTNADSIKVFGVFQDVYQKEDGVNAKKEAATMLKDPTRTVSVDAAGDIRCIAGKSVVLKDAQTGLSGKFWIESDSHTFSGEEHGMSLTLVFKNIMEGEENVKNEHPIATGDHACYYSTGGKKFHSFKKCGSGLGSAVKSTVNEAVKTGREKCLRCWK